LKTTQAPFAANESPFSTYLMGACIRVSPVKIEAFRPANHRVEKG
jgi:hypothetical protein